ncbi:MAG: hypothetical protein FWE22_03500 [Firmicutes bacterium]|nr:hypothetical protein [Bacillota bacterium]
MNINGIKSRKATTKNLSIFFNENTLEECYTDEELKEIFIGTKKPKKIYTVVWPSVKGILYHEFGHAISNKTNFEDLLWEIMGKIKSNDKLLDSRFKKIIDDINENEKKILNEFICEVCKKDRENCKTDTPRNPLCKKDCSSNNNITTSHISNQISKYADRNLGELVAESFALVKKHSMFSKPANRDETHLNSKHFPANIIYKILKIVTGDPDTFPVLVCCDNNNDDCNDCDKNN